MWGLNLHGNMVGVQLECNRQSLLLMVGRPGKAGMGVRVYELKESLAQDAKHNGHDFRVRAKEFQYIAQQIATEQHMKRLSCKDIAKRFQDSLS